MGAAGGGQVGEDSIQLFEDSTLEEFTEFGNEKPGTTGSKQLLNHLAT